MSIEKRVTVKRILDELKCPHLNLYKGDGYYYFCYDDQAKGIYETESVTVCALNHLLLSRWIAEGKDFLTAMREVEKEHDHAAALKYARESAPQPALALIEQIKERREPLSRSTTDCYIHSHELQELWNLQDMIERGLEAQRRAACYMEWIKTNSFDRVTFADYFNAQEKKEQDNEN